MARSKDKQKSRHCKLNPRIQNVFLKALAMTGSVTKAAEAAKVHRWSVYDLKRNDPEFAARFERALDDYAHQLEEELFRRAEEGSDRLLEFAVKNRRRDRYGDRVSVEGALTINLVKFTETEED